MGHCRRRHRHHHVSPFSLMWCLRVPPTKDIPKQSPDNTRATAPSPPLPSSYSNSRPHSSACSEATDPASPRIGCMGQIKRGRTSSSRGSPFSWAWSSSSSSSCNRSSVSSSHEKLCKVKRVFSGRGGACPRASARVGVGDDRGGGALAVAASVAGMDPPLPVVRRGPCGRKAVSLWERRRGRGGGGGGGLKSLQLQQQQEVQQIRLHATAAASSGEGSGANC